MNFPRYRQCKRAAVAVEACGPVCKQHSTKAKAERLLRTVEAEEQRRNRYYAYLNAKAAIKRDPLNP